MDFPKIIDTSNLYHAYLIEDEEETFSQVQDLLKGAITGAEIHVREFDSLGIDDSRTLIHMALMRSLGTQLFIYRARTCTREAQNALLKLFEEPPEKTHFFICLPGVQNMLPTLRSRVQIIQSGEARKSEGFGKNFLSATAAERIKLLENIIKEKDTPAASVLLQEVESELHTQKKNPKNKEALQHIVNVRKVLLDKGASLKVLMESVALIVPRT